MCDLLTSKYVEINLPLQDNKVTGRHADVIQAGYIASEIAHRMVVPGGEVRVESEGGGGKGTGESGERH